MRIIGCSNDIIETSKNELFVWFSSLLANAGASSSKAPQTSPDVKLELLLLSNEGMLWESLDQEYKIELLDKIAALSKKKIFKEDAIDILSYLAHLRLDMHESL